MAIKRMKKSISETFILKYQYDRLASPHFLRDKGKGATDPWQIQRESGKKKISKQSHCKQTGDLIFEGQSGEDIMVDEKESGIGSMGQNPEEWEEMLTHALKNRDHKKAKRMLFDLSVEIKDEEMVVDKMRDLPALDLLLEWVRRLIKADPTDLESVEDELMEESRLWAEYRERYTDIFIPDVLEPYLSKTAALVSPDKEGLQFEGFQKYTGIYKGLGEEAVTLFYSSAGPSDRAPNFFTRFEKRLESLIISRAYRMDLPPGAGSACLSEHIAWLCPEPSHIRRICMDNIKNPVTFDACVTISSEGKKKWQLRDGADLLDTPLGKLAKKLSDRAGLNIMSSKATLDGFGFLDLIFKTAPISLLKPTGNRCS